MSKISITRRNLTAAGAAIAGAVIMTALGPRSAQAQNHGHGHGHSHGRGRGSGGGGANCYVAGTNIRTPSGEREISELNIGDLVITHTGRAKSIKWIGRQRLTREATETWPADVVPVMVGRFALDAETPQRDLFVSPGHALYVDGLLIQAGSLVNGQTIVRRAPTDALVLDYFQIELYDHDVILAEGAPAETFLASANRELFDNRAEYEALYGHQEIAEPVPFAPEIRVEGGRQQLRSRLRSSASPWVDVRQPFDIVRDRIEDRAAAMKAAA